MAVAKKNRRKLTINERLYLWYIAHSAEEGCYVLRIISDDKKFIVNYTLTAHPVITVVGREFGRAERRKGWQRFRVPDFRDNGSITPASVRALIDWCSEPGWVLEVNEAGRSMR